MSKDKATIKNKPTSFEDYLKENISAADYEQMPQWMGMSAHAITRMFNRPSRMSLEQIAKLAQILNKHPYQLISDYKLGHKVVTLYEMEQIEKGYKTVS